MLKRLAAPLSLALALAAAADARASEFIPDLGAPVVLTSQTQFKIVLKEQARVEIPATVVFNVTDVAVATPQEGTALIKATNVVVLPNHRLRIAIAPLANAFVDQTGQSSWAASKISWARVAQTNGNARAGTFSNAGIYKTILTCQRHVSACQGTYKFTLGADPAQTMAGQHILYGSYRVSSI